MCIRDSSSGAGAGRGNLRLQIIGGSRGERMKFLRKPAIHWVRRAVQMAFLSVFILLAWAALYPPSRSIPENIFLRIDPLAAIAAARGSGVWLYLLPAWI